MTLEQLFCGVAIATCTARSGPTVHRADLAFFLIFASSEILHV
jgi:hypothetical protein